MKYQTFNSSCCYAGLANMLDDYSIDVEDRDIATEANLPYMLRFVQKNNCYLAGPMLQGSQWFDLYLRPHGLHFAERTMSREAAVNFLASADGRVMLGIELSDSGRQAAVFDGVRGNRFHFINNKWKDSEGSERYMYTAQELYDRLADENVLGWLEKAAKSEPDFPEELCVTLATVQKYRESLHEFCSVPRDRITVQWAMEPLFRPLLIDLLSMMELVGEARIVLMIKVLQRSLAAAMQAQEEKIVLFDYISEQQLDETIGRYIEIVQMKLQKLVRE